MTVPDLVQIATDYGLECAPDSLTRLAGILEPLPDGERGVFLDQLRWIDSIRENQGKIDLALEGIPAIVTRGRSYVAEKRALARQSEIDLRRRQADFDAASLALSRKRLEEHRGELERLERSLDELDEQRSQWRRQLLDAMRAIYSDLSLLRSDDFGARSSGFDESLDAE